MLGQMMPGNFLGLNLSNPEAFAEDNNIVFDKLIPLNDGVQVKQNGVPISDAEIDSMKPIQISFDFRVPVLGDRGWDGTPEFTEGDPHFPEDHRPTDDEVIYKGDIASFMIAEGFTIDTGSETYIEIDLTLANDTEKVGTLRLSNETNTDSGLNQVKATITFDGPDDIFNGDSSYVTTGFTADLLYNGSLGNEPGEEYTIQLLGKTFTIKVPVIDIELDKNGTHNGDFVDWVVIVNAAQGDNEDYDLKGFKLIDNLENVGEYVPDSIMVGTSNDLSMANAIALDDPISDTNKVLTYTFPEGSTDTQYIFFKTKIDESLYEQEGISIKNEAVIQDSAGNEKADDNDEVDIEVTWIKKEAGEVEYRVENGEPVARITWVITANELGLTLPDAYIKDVLDENTTFVEAQWYQYVAGGNPSEATTVGAILSNYPTDGEFLYPDNAQTITSPVQLKIIVDVGVKNPGDTFIAGFYINNEASIHWTWDSGDQGRDSESISVNIGTNNIQKSTGGYDFADQTIPWTVTVKESLVSPQLRVLDLLVYGSSTNFAIQNGYTIEVKEKSLDESEMPSALLQVDLETLLPNGSDLINSLPKNVNQRYLENSLAYPNHADALDYVVYVIKDGSGHPVADLIVVSGPDGAGIDVLKNGVNQDKAFTFKTKVTNPSLYAKVSGTFTINNTATLFSNNNRLNSALDSVKPRPNFLRKDMVENRFAASEGLLNDSNYTKSTTDAKKGFNYIDRSVVFRLHVNHRGDGDLTTYEVVDGNGNINIIGNITVSDTLPEGWEFIDVIDGENYLIFEGDSSTGGFVTPTNRITEGAINDILESATFTEATAGVNEKAAFEFKALNKPYIIYLRAQPSEEKAIAYFNINGTTTVTNNLSLKGENWTSGISTTRTVSIESEVLSKSLNSSVDGEITWTVGYKPDEVDLLDNPPDEMIITDTLSAGMELPVDADGNLNFTGSNFKVEKLTLQANGTYTAEIASEALTDYYSYNFESRELTIHILDQKQAYRFTYVTDLTGTVNTTIENTVTLTGINFGAPIMDSYSINSNDVTASRQKNGFIEITKINTNDAPIAGVEFAIFTLNGYQLRTGQTTASGKLELRGLPPGTFTMRETGTVVPYEKSAVVYDVVAQANDDGTTTVSIDEQTGDDSNKITIVNYQTSDAEISISKVRSKINGNAAITEYDTVGDEITYKITLTNSGSTTVYNPSVSDPKATTGPTYVSGDENTDDILDIGEAWVYEATYVVTQTDLDRGHFNNTVTGTGSADLNEDGTGDTDVSDDDDATVNANQDSSIVTVKTATDIKDDADTIKAKYDTVGDEISYQITLTNNGNITVYNPSVSDSKATTGPTYVSGDMNNNSKLDVSEAWLYEATYVITQADLDRDYFTNTAKGLGLADTNGDGTGDTEVSQDDDATVDADQSPSLELVKTLSSINGDSKYFRYSKVGDVIEYTFVVENTGNVTLTDVKINDDKLEIIGLPINPSTLAPGAKGSATATYLITQDDLSNRSVENTATALGTPPIGDEVTDTDDEKVDRIPPTTVETPGRITVVKTDSMDSSILLAGAEFEVKNSVGELVGVLVTDASGRAYIDGLALGSYMVVETKAPIGYVSEGKQYEVFIGYNINIQLNITNDKIAEVVDPVDPVEPFDPEDPVDPEEPEEPVDPIDPEDPDDSDEGTVIYEPDEDVIDIEVIDPPKNGVIIIEDDTIKYIPDESYDGDDKLEIRVTKEDGTQEDITINITEDLVPKGPIVPIPPAGVAPKHWLYSGLALLFAAAYVFRKVMA